LKREMQEVQKRKEEGGVVEEEEKVEMAVGAAIGNSGRLTFFFSSAIHVVPHWKGEREGGFTLHRIWPWWVPST
jgi:hypothetical protein